MQEVAFLLAHGILHLLGRDHETKDERIEMDKRHYEKDYALIVNEAGRGQNQLFEKFIIDSQNLPVQFEGRMIPRVYL